MYLLRGFCAFWKLSVQERQFSYMRVSQLCRCSCRNSVTSCMSKVDAIMLVLRPSAAIVSSDTARMNAVCAVCCALADSLSWPEGLASSWWIISVNVTTFLCCIQLCSFSRFVAFSSYFFSPCLCLSSFIVAFTKWIALTVGSVHMEVSKAGSWFVTIGLFSFTQVLWSTHCEGTAILLHRIEQLKRHPSPSCLLSVFPSGHVLVTTP